MDSLRLKYAVRTTPDPLQVGPQTGGPSDPALATLQIVVWNPGGSYVDCQSISFSFLEGTNARDFFSDSTGIVASPPTGWSLHQQGSLFTARPDTPQDGQVGPDSLVFTLSNIPVNEQPGTTQMMITEVTPSNTGTLSLPLAKFPPQFSVGDLKAVPDTVVQGGSTLLTWSGSDSATYELHYTNAEGELVSITHPAGEPDQPLPSSGSYSVEGLQQDTTFYLCVTLTVPGADEPLSVERTFPVTVEIPPVQIISFTADPPIVIYAPPSPPPTSVTLSWEVTGASQVLLNGNIVEGNSTVIVISETTTFTLEATGSPFPVYESQTVTLRPNAAQVSVPSGNSVEVTFYAAQGTYIVNWSVDWETGETAGTATNSMTVTSGGGEETVVWGNVPMDMPPPYGGIVAARCSITGFAGGPLNGQWP